MRKAISGWCRLPMTEKLLSAEVDKYFDRCKEEGIPPTPSGLALSLGVRTSELRDERLSPEQRNVIERAMQRLEANTMEIMLTRGGVKGIENVLERVEESGDGSGFRRQAGRMSDEEIEKKLRQMVERIEDMLGE